MGDLGRYIAGYDTTNEAAIFLPKKYTTGKYVAYHKGTKTPAIYFDYISDLLNGKVRAYYKST